MKKGIVSIIFASLLCNPLAHAETLDPFVDLKNHWAKETVEWAMSSEIVKGYTDHRFRPDQTVTESEFVAMMLRTFSEVEIYKRKDLTGDWFTPYYTLAAQFNLPIQGKVNDPILRKEVAQFITATQGYNYDAEGSIAFLLESGISKGRSDRSIQGFDPSGKLTRAEAVQFLRNLAEHKLNLEIKKRPTQQQINKDTWKYQDSTRITALGDSLTFGLFLNEKPLEPSKKAFPYLISDHANVENLGVTGSTSVDLLEAVKTAKYQEAIKQSHLITITIGSNDLIDASSRLIKAFQENPSYQPSKDEQIDLLSEVEKRAEGIKGNMQAVIKEIRKHSNSPIVLFNLYNPFPNVSALQYLHHLNEKVIMPANEAIKTLEDPFAGIFVANAHGNFEGKQLSFVRVWSYDFHPTEEGQKALAKSALEVLNMDIATLSKSKGS